MLAIGFVPVLTALAQESGLSSAYVYGYMYVNRNLSDDSYSGSIEAISRDTTLSRTTIYQAIKILQDSGHITDMTPNANGKPHIYKLSTRYNMRIELWITTHANYSNPSNSGQPTGSNPYGIRTPRGTETEQVGPGMNHVHDEDDNNNTGLLSTWTSMGFDRPALKTMLAAYNGDTDKLLYILSQWVKELDYLPKHWGLGLIYKKIQAGELPPEREPTIHDEILARQSAK